MFCVVCFIHVSDTSVGEEIGVDVAMSIRHPGYDNVTKDNDIMLLKLERSTTVTNHIVLNANDAAPADNQAVRVLGWVSSTCRQHPNALLSIFHDTISFIVRRALLVNLKIELKVMY